MLKWLSAASSLTQYCSFCAMALRWQALQLLAAGFLARCANAVSIRGAEVSVDVLAASSSPAGLEDTLMGLLEDGNSNTPALAKFVAQIKAMLEKDMKPKVLEHRDEEQSRLDGALRQFSTCKNRLATDRAETSMQVAAANTARKTLDTLTQAYKVAVDAEQSCLQTLSALTSLQKTVCLTLDTLSAQSSPCGCSASAASYGADSARIAKCWADVSHKWAETDKSCKDATAKMKAQQAVCSPMTAAVKAADVKVQAAKQQYPQLSCSAYTQGVGTCKRSDSCWSQALANLKTVQAAARSQEAGMKTEWESIMRMSCLANVFAHPDEDRSSSIKACKEASPDTSRIFLIYEKPPAAPVCSVPSEVSCPETTTTTTTTTTPARLRMLVTSVDHAFGPAYVGQYFNFLKSDIGLPLNAEWRLMMTNKRTGQRAEVVVWGSKNGGSTGDSHGRLTQGPAPGQFQTGDVLELDNQPTAAQRYYIKISSVDHAFGPGVLGQYFNFDMSTAGLKPGEEQKIFLTNERTKERKKAVLWGSKNGGSTGDSHGRWDDGTAAPGQFKAGDTLTTDQVIVKASRFV